jgi:subtilisin family serine protease
MSLFVNAAELRRLLADPDVVSIQEDVPSPPLFEYNITVPHADQVLAKGFSGTGHAIAILDTGSDKTHPMLQGRVVAEACSSTNDSANGLSSFCPGGVSFSVKPGSGVNCPTAIHGCEHGTHVASIAAGKLVTTSGKTLTGVGRGANIIAMQVFTRRTKGCSPDPTPCIGSFATDRVVALHRLYELRNTLKIIAVNMSIGQGKYSASCDSSSPAEATEISNLRAVGIATTIASGNNGYDGFISSPACISTAVAVGNSNADDMARQTSNNSTLVKVMAPGTAILGATPGNHYASLSGTSQAAPYVAGAIALLKNAQPSATMASILTGLECGGKMITRREVPGDDPKFLLPPRPRVDLLATLDFLKYPTTAVRSWNFDTPAQGLDWTPFWGTWTVAGGDYKQTPKLNWSATSVSTCNVASTVTASLLRQDPPAGEEPGSYTGVIVRAGIDYKNVALSGYYMSYDRCHAGADGHCSGLPNDPRGQAEVYRLDNAKLSDGFGFIRLCIKRIPIAANAVATIKIVSSGSHHTYYLNGTLVCSFDDGTYTTGRDMIAAYDVSSAPRNVLTNLAVKSFSIKYSGLSAAAEPAISPIMDPSAFAPKPAPANGALNMAVASPE